PEKEHPARLWGARAYLSDRLFPKRTEARAKLFGKKLRLFPGSEMTALFHLVVVDEIGIGPLRPVPGRLVEFVREDAHGSRDFDALGTEKGELILPIEASRRNPRVGQPEQRDVVAHIVRREAFGLPLNGTRDELQTARVVVE